MSSIICGNCKKNHTNVQEVRDCYKASNTPRISVDPGTGFTHIWEGATNANVSQTIEQVVTEALAAQEPSEFQREAVRTFSEKWTPEDAGIYANNDGEIFKVYKALNGSHMLCKKLVADKESKTAEFQYVGAPKRHVNHDMKLTLEQAKTFGAIYGVCCVCGRTLTDENSIAAGIGPICAGKF